MIYEIEIKGNDGYIMSTRVKADSFIEAVMRADTFIEAAQEQTIEELRITRIEEVG